MEHLSSHWTDFREIWYLSIFWKSVKIKVRLTLALHAAHYYSTASHTTCPDGVLVLPDFHNHVKKKYWKYWLQVCTSRLLHVCSFSDCLPSRKPCKCICWTLARERLRNRLLWHLTQCLPLIYRSWPPTSDALNHYTPLSQHAGLKYQWGLTSQLMFCAPQATLKIPD